MSNGTCRAGQIQTAWGGTASVDDARWWPGWLHVDYHPGLISGLTRRTFRFPHYANSGHVLEINEPMELRDDLAAWWAEVRP